jgi:phosphate binding protein
MLMPEPDCPAAAADVSVLRVLGHLQWLGQDSRAGRSPGTAGATETASYLAAYLEEVGLLPAGDAGLYAQPVPMHRSSPRVGTRLSLTGRAGAWEARLGDDYVLQTDGPQTLVPRPAPLIFVGYGIVAPEYDYNDYQSVDVEGAIVVFLAGEPASRDSAYFAGNRPTVHSFPEVKRRVALSRGARGSILIPTGRDGSRPWEQIRNEYAFDRITLAYGVSENLCLVWNPERAGRLFAGAERSWPEVVADDRTGGMRSFPLPLQATFDGKFEETDFVAANVAGLLPGSDPQLRDSYVIVCAHYDHLGIGPAVRGDSIYNGVVDNAAGTAALLEMARVLASRKPAPRRSVLFLFVTGEESGLLGSTYYCDHPLVPLSRTVAALNVDGLSIFDTVRSFVALGAEESTLGDLLREYGRDLNVEIAPLPPLFEFHDEFLRSDQVAFAAAGVPSVLLIENLDYDHGSWEDGRDRFLAWGREVYHTPFDDLGQPINADAVGQHVRLLTRVACGLANTPTPPAWRAGSPYLAARLRSLAEGASRVVRVKGSDTMFILTRRWADRFMETHAGISVAVEGGGSGGGVRALIDGRAEICATSRPLLPAEVRELQETRGSLGVSVLCAKDALSIYLHPRNPVRNLTLAQVGGILDGRIRDWSEVGGGDGAIRVYGRKPGSGTYTFLADHVLGGGAYRPDAVALDGTAEVVAAVAADRLGFGYGGFAYGAGVVQCVVDGVPPTPATVRHGTYPISRYLYLYTAEPPVGDAKVFVDWVLSREGQEIVAATGYIPLWEL